MFIIVSITCLLHMLCRTSGSASGTAGVSAWNKKCIVAAHLVVVGGCNLVSFCWILAGGTGMIQVCRVSMCPSVGLRASVRGGDCRHASLGGSGGTARR
jgi:hypothetical protein